MPSNEYIEKESAILRNSNVKKIGLLFVLTLLVLSLQGMVVFNLSIKIILCFLFRISNLPRFVLGLVKNEELYLFKGK